jgi:hypothetical protein
MRVQGGHVRRALFPLYRPVKVVPAQPGRCRSTALAQPVTTDGASRGRSGKRCYAGRIYQLTQHHDDIHRAV